MKPEEIRALRHRLKMSPLEFSEFLAMSGYNSFNNLEIGFRNPNKLALKLLRYISSLSQTKALTFIQEFNRHGEK